MRRCIERVKTTLYVDSALQMATRFPCNVAAIYTSWDRAAACCIKPAQMAASLHQIDYSALRW